jgi:hypothetical protein
MISIGSAYAKGNNYTLIDQFNTGVVVQLSLTSEGSSPDNFRGTLDNGYKIFNCFEQSQVGGLPFAFESRLETHVDLFYTMFDCLSLDV